MIKFVCLTLLASAGVTRAAAPDVRPLEAEDFAIGTGGSTCEAQGQPMGPLRSSVFDRKWSILCSGTAKAVGNAYVLRDTANASSRIAATRDETLDCGNTPDAFSADGTTCTGTTSNLQWRVYMRRAQGGIVAVEGYAAYDSALRLALASIVDNRVVPGEVSIADLGTGDPLALAKARAETAGVATLIGQGYRGNGAGSFAEAAEFFAAAPAVLADTEATDPGSRDVQLHEALVNRALQLSNLGSFAEAARQFALADAIAVRDPVQLRLSRNYAAIDAVNRRQFDQALTILDRPVPQFAPVASAPGTVQIDRTTAAGLNSSTHTAMAGLLGQPARLSPQERAAIIDAQALQLRGTVLRLQEHPQEARKALVRAYDEAIKVHDGRVISIYRLRGQILSELALSYEADGNLPMAETTFRDALILVESQYPDSASVNLIRARLAGFLVRHGQKDEALDLYRKVAANVETRRAALVGMENLMQPYFDLLVETGTDDPARVAEVFLASQLLQSPGAADTLTQLSRQLEGGSREASALFRRSQAVSRDLERTRIEIARLSAAAAEGGDSTGLEPLQQRQAQLAEAQLTVMDQLSAFPRYRAIASRTVTLDDMRAALKPGEGYLKLAQVAGSLYAIYLTPDTQRAWKLPLSTAQTETLVNTLRDSISLTINGVQSTYPFDIDDAVRLDDALLGPARADIAHVTHLIFEPAGPLLRLPINLLTDDRKGVAAYHQRVEAGGEEYDFTGIDWLGRDRAVSTALSAASFRDARKAPASQAADDYLGLGDNVPLGPVSARPDVRSGGEVAIDADCNWPVSAWNQPISPRELNEASALFGAGRSEVLTGSQFTDDGIIARKDLGAFRIVHFATHGLVTPPRAGCPVRPALLTSFGGAGSDGLLSFGEIFNLSLDADLVVLSGCDTAAGAGLGVTREAGLTTGGGEALDGLVRAFIAAGGRQVIASHWPAPDDYNATERLFSGFYRAKSASIGEALRESERALMDDPDTSHPYYWAGFAVIGDAARPVPAR
ncbi:CHAT domain-containing protein [Novosphingobium album (ex Hu et al. 2023)]|uniref:CHAT domain-containing protein n=1 Tax=Novosphingobium album (ex Hu et al. 2023) TaxID=2930093 RepID=A0ABT0AXI9_9SPHN|nr:CHAT domain-containing tetratricopeptide repeat protein [Novosphingobium album (ex Hu et al. 2023)]MCJ2177492.1 CHAT domain-containing protein [Novosphingobium album (ex Hu et al. 2023)]